MKRKTLLLSMAAALSIFVYSCGNDQNESHTTTEQTTETATPADVQAGNNNASANDPERGIGKYTNVELTHPLDEKMVEQGKTIYDVKCASCHKLSDEKLVGPGWAGMTDRHSPEWIMNFLTNTDEMIDKDPKAQAMLEVCMVRMPDQNLSDDDARHTLEYMRKNDNKN